MLVSGWGWTGGGGALAHKRGVVMDFLLLSLVFALVYSSQCDFNYVAPRTHA
jgi:hypothetical protein